MRVSLVAAATLATLATVPAAFGDAVTHQADAVHSGHATVRGLDPPLHGRGAAHSPTSCPTR